MTGHFQESEFLPHSPALRTVSDRRTGWNLILKGRFDIRTRSCAFAQMFPRLLEH